jgi:hypothetical protein
MTNGERISDGFELALKGPVELLDKGGLTQDKTIRDNYDTIKDIVNNVRIMGQHERVFIDYIET